MFTVYFDELIVCQIEIFAQMNRTSIVYMMLNVIYSICVLTFESNEVRRMQTFHSLGHHFVNVLFQTVQTAYAPLLEHH